MGEHVGHDAVLPGVRVSPAASHSSPRAGRGTRAASGSWTASSAVVAVGLRVDEARARRRRARPGSRRRARAARCRGCAPRPRPRRPARGVGAVAPDDRHREAPRARAYPRGRVRRWTPPAACATLGLRIGELEPGPANAIADVAGRRRRPRHRGARRARSARRARRRAHGRDRDRAGRARDAALAAAGRGRRRAQRRGGAHRLLQVAEWGVIETPVYLTATMAVGRVFDGAVAAAVAADPARRRRRRRHPGRRRVRRQLAQRGARGPGRGGRRGPRAGRRGARRPVVQGAVGAGTGMICFGWKGGIGTASRARRRDATVGVLVLANFGAPRDLRIDGVPVGRLLGATPAGGARDRRAAASPSSPPTRRCTPRSSSASRGAPASGSRARGRSPTTAAARSSSPSRPLAAADRARRRRARPALRRDRRRHRGGRRQRALERRARRRSRGARRRGAAARRGRRAARGATGGSDRPLLGFGMKSAQIAPTPRPPSRVQSLDAYAGAGPAGSDTGGALACGQGARRPV